MWEAKICFGDLRFFLLCVVQRPTYRELSNRIHDRCRLLILFSAR
jgi:hypothetical protein